MEQDQIDDIEDRLTKAVRMVTSLPDAASHGVKVALSGAALHEADMHVMISHQDRNSATYTLVIENRKLRDELRVLKSAKGQTWQDFLNLIEPRFRVGPTGWKGQVAGELGISTSDLTSFEAANRVPMSLLRHIETLPFRDPGAVEQKKSRRTNFQKVAGEMTDILVGAGTKPTDIARMISELVQNYDGDETTLNQILGRRTTFSPDEIRPAEDLSALTLKELRAMANDLYGKEGSIRPIESFVRAFTYVDISGFASNAKLLHQLNSSDCAKVRAAYHREKTMRAKSHDYERISRAFGLLKRTRYRRNAIAAGVTYEDVAQLGVRCFGTDYKEMLAQLWGWDVRLMREIVNHGGAVPDEMAPMVTCMRACLEAVPLDDPDFVDKVHRRVKEMIAEK